MPKSVRPTNLLYKKKILRLLHNPYCNNEPFIGFQCSGGNKGGCNKAIDFIGKSCVCVRHRCLPASDSLLFDLRVVIQTKENQSTRILRAVHCQTRAHRMCQNIQNKHRTAGFVGWNYNKYDSSSCMPTLVKHKYNFNNLFEYVFDM